MKTKKNNKIIFLLISAVCLFIFFSKVALADWNGLPYSPGSTDDPECLPSQTNCDVLPAITGESDPLSIHLNQTTPQTFSAGTLAGSGLLEVASGQLGLDTSNYVTGTPWTVMGYLTGNQTITLGGILSGSGTTSITASVGSGYYMPSTSDQTAWNAKQNTITTGTTAQYLRGDLSLATFPTLVSAFTNDSGYLVPSALTPYALLSGATFSGAISATNLSGTNTGDNAANTTYASDYRAGNFTAGTNYLTPSGSAAALTSFPTFNQNTTGSASTLTTAQNINGVSFNGSAGITIPVNSTNDIVTATAVYPLWTTATGNTAAKVSTTALSFVPSTGILTATGFAGPLVGNVTGNVSGSSGSTTGNAATVTNGVYTTGAGTVYLTPSGNGSSLTGLTATQVGLSNVTNNKQIPGLSGGTTSGHLVTWGADGYTVEDGGAVPTLSSLGGLSVTGVTTGATSQAQVFTDGTILSNLTAGYLPYAESSDKKLVNSPFYTDGTNVGIGTETPGYNLDVNGSIGNSNGDLYIQNSEGNIYLLGSGGYGVFTEAGTDNENTLDDGYGDMYVAHSFTVNSNAFQVGENVGQDYVNTLDNVLDDGEGNMTVGSTLTVNNEVDVANVLTVNSNAFQVGENFGPDYVNTLNNVLDDGDGDMYIAQIFTVNSNAFQVGVNVGSDYVNTLDNVLDDGSGNMTVGNNLTANDEVQVGEELIVDTDAFTVGKVGQYNVYTKHNVLDDDSGDVVVSGSLTLGGVSQLSWPTDSWSTSGSNVYRSSGKVGIGVVNPTNILSLGNGSAQKFWIENSNTDVAGQSLTIAGGGTVAGTSINNVAGGSLILQSGLGTGTGSSSISFQTGTTLTSGKVLQTMSTKMTILGNGNVGIGTVTPGTYMLNITGTGYLGGASAWVYGSDRNLKNNIVYLSDNSSIDALNIIGQLKPATFNYITGAQNEAGFIAQDVQTVLPNLVVQNPDGLLGLKTDDLIPYTVAAIQEMNLNLEGVAGTVTPIPGSTADTFVTAFFNNVKTQIGTWLADAGNGIGNIFADTFNAKEKICVDGECLTKDDIHNLLLLAHQNVSTNTDSATSSVESTVIDTTSNTTTDDVTTPDTTAPTTPESIAPTTTIPEITTQTTGIPPPQVTQDGQGGGVTPTTDSSTSDTTTPVAQ